MNSDKERALATGMMGILGGFTLIDPRTAIERTMAVGLAVGVVELTRTVMAIKGRNEGQQVDGEIELKNESRR